MKIVILGAALNAALFTHAMHVSSDEELKLASKRTPNLIEMTNFAAKPPAAHQHNKSQDNSSSESDSDEDQKEAAPNHLSSLNFDPTTWYSSIYTLASIEKDNAGKPK